jgi:uncharacterized protein YfaS (alpha-2-macroglobulin family)
VETTLEMGGALMEVKKRLTALGNRLQQLMSRQNHQKALLIGGISLLLLALVGYGVATFLDSGIKLVALNPDRDFNPKTNLTFTFTADAVEETAIGVTVTEQLVKFTPEIPGRFRWVSRRELQFLPERPFLPSTAYRAELKSGIVKTRDRFLSGKRSLQFNTKLFQVESISTNFIYPAEHKKGLNLQVNLTFNYPVNAAELQKALEIRQVKTGQEVKYNLSTAGQSASFILKSEPLELAGKDQQIEIVISKGFRPVGGKIGLAADYRYATVLGAKKPLTVIEAVSKNESTKSWISVHCSESVVANAVTNFIRLKPEVPFKAEVNGDYILIKSDRFKSGASYNLRLTAGLAALNGYPLKRDYSATVFFTDLEPSLRFNSPGRYLSSKGHLNLGLETVNIAKVNLEISQIYANNLVSYLNNTNHNEYCYSGHVERLGRIAESTVLNIDAPHNELVTTPINLKEYLTGNFRGIIQVVVYSDAKRWIQDSKYVIVTDIGIVAKMGRDELVVWVNSLEGMEPKPEAKISLISRNNQVLATAVTDKEGVACFKDIKKACQGYEPFLILAETGGDFAFVQFDKGLIEVADFDVRGRQHLVDGYEAFLYMDRDIFRPGDAGHLVAVLRGPNAALPPEFPVKLEIRQPDGRIYQELKSNTMDRGVCEFALKFPDYAQTGKYQAVLRVAEEAVGTTAFSVEDFMPERIKVTVKTDRSTYLAGETAAIKVQGLNLFGPPAAGRRSELKVTLEPAKFTAAGFNTYTFGDSDQAFTIKELELGESKLDESGMAVYNYDFPRELNPPAKVRALFHATVLEDGGRAVGSYKVVDLHAYERYIGVKALTSKAYCEMNKPFPIKYVVVDKEGQPVEQVKLHIDVYRITWNSIYRKTKSGRYEYVSEEEKERVEHRTVTAAKGAQTYQYVPKDYGKYQIVLRDAKGRSRAGTSFFASGWGYSPWTMDAPEKVSLEPERKTYQVGEKAKIQVKAPFSGKALVTVEREKVYSYQIVEFKENTGIVTIPVKAEYKPNVYVTLQLIRSIKSLEKRAPARAFGTVPLQVDCSAHQLTVAIKAAEEVRPKQPLVVQVKLGRASGPTYLTLAAVDEGICQLTNYQTPDPVNFFYGKRSLNINSYDLYGMILPEVESIKPKSAPGGDAAIDGVRKRNLNPVAVNRVKPVALWSGLVKANRNGEARIKLAVPQFNGTLRLMAVAAGGTDFGYAQKKIVVRDPIVISPTFPRFVAVSDKFTVPVAVFNGTGKAGDFQLTMATNGPVSLISADQQNLSLKNREEKLVYFDLQAKNALGKGAFTLRAQGNRQTCEVKEELPVRPATPLTHELKSGSITAKTPLNITPAAHWLPGTASYQLTLAPFPSLKFAGSLQYLLSYPHGCVEQTTSKLFPLLYFDELARATQSAVFKGGNADYYLNEGIAKLEAMQLREGCFAYWPGGTDSNEWCSVYASHFLVEARKAGYAVSDRVYDQMVKYLQTLVKVGDNSAERLQTRVYALYVLSLAGKAQLSTMAYLKSFAMPKLADYSRAQLAAAYCYAGDRNTARKLLPATFTVANGARQSGGNLNSPIREDAIILGALADLNPRDPTIYKLVSRLSRSAKPGYWGTTQENAFALMALGKIYKQKSVGDYHGEVWANHTKIATFDNKKIFHLQDARLGKGTIQVKITGTGECYYHLQSSGVAASRQIKEYSQGLRVSREYLDRYGNPVNRAALCQGSLIVAHITIEPQQDHLENLAIVDLLPGGLEIDNPRLANSGSLAWLAKKTLTPSYMDIRDDRLVLFVSLKRRGKYDFYYALRAVSCGEFTLPSVKAECMYEPELSSYASGGRITIERD